MADISNVPGDSWKNIRNSDIRKMSTPQGFYEWLLINSASILAATQAEVNAGIINNKYVSPLTLANSPCCTGGGLFNIDGGTADSVYTPNLFIDGGGA